MRVTKYVSTTKTEPLAFHYTLLLSYTCKILLSTEKCNVSDAVIRHI